MNKFWQVRLATFAWGFSVTYAFTGKLGLSSALFLTMAAGNTIIMKLLIK